MSATLKFDNVQLKACSGSSAWVDITGKPSTFPPSAHTHPATDVTEDTTHRFATDMEKTTWNAKVSFPGFGTTAGTAAEGNDARLSDARTPLAHTQAWSTITTTPTTLAGYGITDAQPLDSDLTSIAALTTTPFGRSLLTQADAAATRTTIGAGTSSFDGAYASLTGIPSTFTPAAHNQAWSTITTTPTTLAGYGITDAQPLDSDLTSIAALTTTPFGRSLLTQADAAATRTTIGAGTSSFDGAYASLTGIPSTFTPAAHDQAWSTITSTPTTLSGYGITDAQGLDSDLTALAGLSSNGLIARTADGAAATRTITGTANQVIVTNGDGVSGNPTLSLPQSIATTSTPTFSEVSTTRGIVVRKTENIPTEGGLTVGARAKDQAVSGEVGFLTFRSDDAANQLQGLIVLRTDATAANRRLSIDCIEQGIAYRNITLAAKGGRVGIGTTSPAARLDLGASTGVVQYIYKDSSANAGLGINLSGGSAELSLFAGATEDGAGRISFGRRRVDTETYTERMVIDAASGKVGIGTSSPAAQLHLRSASDNIAEAIRLDNPTDNDDNGSKIVWRNADVSKDAAFFAARRIGSSDGIALTFGTAEDWSTAAATEKMRIAGNGYVGIGTTTPQESVDSIGAIAVRGNSSGYETESKVGVLAYREGAVRVLSAGPNTSTRGAFNVHLCGANYTGAIDALTVSNAGGLQLHQYGAGTLVTDTSGNVTASSDSRLKTVTGSFTRGLDDVLKLTPRTYRWNEKSGMNTEDENVGFIAQEVLGAVPEAVGTMKTTDYEEDDAATGKKVRKSKREAAEYLTLSDRPIIAALVNAVKELKAENDTLRARVSALENGKAAK